MKTQEQDKDLNALTVDELRSYEGLEGLAKEEAIEIINTLKELSLIVHSIVSDYGKTRTISEFCKEEQQENSKK